MKLEPVAIPQWLLDAIDSYAACSDDDDRSIVARRVVVEKLRQFSAIPEGYVVVPVEQAKNAERYVWLRDVSVPPHNFYLSVPVEFDGVRYKPQEVDDYIDKAMIAAKEQS